MVEISRWVLAGAVGFGGEELDGRIVFGGELGRYDCLLL